MLSDSALLQIVVFGCRRGVALLASRIGSDAKDPDDFGELPSVEGGQRWWHRDLEKEGMSKRSAHANSSWTGHRLIGMNHQIVGSTTVLGAGWGRVSSEYGS